MLVMIQLFTVTADKLKVCRPVNQTNNPVAIISERIKPRISAILIMVAVFTMVSAATHHASAETYMGLGVGKSLRQTISGFKVGDAFKVTLPDLASKSSIAYGLKLGHFFKAIPGFGLEFNYSFSDPDMVKEKVDAMIMGAPTGLFAGQTAGNLLVSADINHLSTFGVLAVWRVTDKQFLMNLDGIQPYLGVGLGLSILDVEKFSVLNTDESSVGETSGESNSSVGLLISAGLNYTLTKHTKVYGEFKYKDTSFEFDKLDGANKYEFDASETSFVFGLSYHF